MIIRRISNFSFLMLLLSCAIVLSSLGCGDNTSSTTNTTLSSTTTTTAGGATGAVISGMASKGPISGGTVKAYALGAGGEQGALLGTATTQADGSYSLSLGGYTGNVLLVLTGGTYTDEATNTVVNNTSTYRAAVTNATGSVSASITPMTELAVRDAGPLTTGNISASNNRVSTMLGVNILTTRPADLTSSTSAGASQDEKDYGLALASLSQMAHDGGKSVDDVVDEMETDLSDDKLDTTGPSLNGSMGTFLTSGNNHSGMTINDTHLDESIEAETNPPSDTTAPSIPTGVMATAVSSSQIGLTWTASSDNVAVTGYKVYRDGTYLKTADGVGTADMGLAASTNYCYSVTAIDAASNESNRGNESCATTNAQSATAPNTPTNVLATPGDGVVTLSWDTVSGATVYSIYQATSPGVTKGGFATIVAGSPFTTKSGAVTNGTKYYYVITASNDVGESDESAEVSATPDAGGGPTVPAAPTGVIATGGDTTITMTWNPVDTATSYNIYWSGTPGVTKTNGNAVLDETSPATSPAGTFTNGVTYYAVVTAINANGESVESAEVSVTPQTQGGGGGSGTAADYLTKKAVGNTWVLKQTATMNGAPYPAGDLTTTTTVTASSSNSYDYSATNSQGNTAGKVEIDQAGNYINTQGGETETFLPATFSVGTQYIMQAASATFETGVRNGTVTAIDVTRAVPAGTFNDCIQVTWTRTDPNGTQVTGQMYYSKAVGYLIEQIVTVTVPGVLFVSTSQLEAGYIANP